MLIKVLGRIYAFLLTMVYKCIYPFAFHIVPFKVFFNGILMIAKKGKLTCEGSFVSRSGCTINIYGGQVCIKNGVTFNRGVFLNSQLSVEIGEDSFIGPNVLIYDHDHSIVDGVVKKRDYVQAPVVIGDNVWIGANSVILKGVTIGDRTIVAAGSIVSKDIPANTLFIQKKVSTYLKNK
ncbi:DapH/DapD/GlmU-related protein [Thiomicrorhabdus sp. 6S3-12]|uniref:acyltransferase n=1 Tax=Thiomicrorhabdus sp. 6S3-12 TaxID=2819681 RepID=UPI001AAD8B40|nr:acyltransferase [Thiomicrorhabdus sp. 6S3-12]MBO1922986.1 acyltransferase [Thiomicrorhabdus sp. 6S3-12]